MIGELNGIEFEEELENDEIERNFMGFTKKFDLRESIRNIIIKTMKKAKGNVGFRWMMMIIYLMIFNYQLVLAVNDNSEKATTFKFRADMKRFNPYFIK